MAEVKLFCVEVEDPLCRGRGEAVKRFRLRISAYRPVCWEASRNKEDQYVVFRGKEFWGKVYWCEEAGGDWDADEEPCNKGEEEGSTGGFWVEGWWEEDADGKPWAKEPLGAGRASV